MAYVHRTLEQIRRMKPKIDRAKINRTTNADIRRHMIEDGQGLESDLSSFAPVIPPQILRKHLGMTQSSLPRRCVFLYRPYGIGNRAVCCLIQPPARC